MNVENRSERRSDTVVHFEIQTAKGQFRARSIDVALTSARITALDPANGLPLTDSDSMPFIPCVRAEANIPGLDRTFTLREGRIVVDPHRPVCLLRFTAADDDLEEFFEGIHILGKQLERYRIARVLDRGGSSHIYEAVDTKLNRTVALKLLLPFLRGADTAKSHHASVLAEARRLSALNHPNIVSLFDVHSVNELLFVVMELVNGTLLRELIVPGGMPPSEVLSIARQIALGLSHAHQAGLVHGDISPSNVIVTSAGHVKLLDFGLAHTVARFVRSTLTSDQATVALPPPRRLVGTLHYMAPEQTFGKEVDVRSDVFSFGVVLYEMLLGAVPFSAHNQTTLLEQIRQSPVVFPSAARHLPAPIVPLLARCLAKPPEARFQTMAEILTTLDSMRRPRFKPTRLTSLPARFAAACFLCGQELPSNRLFGGDRVCDESRCVRDTWPANEHATLVSVIPGFRSPYDLDSLPLLSAQHGQDVFAVSRDNDVGASPQPSTIVPVSAPPTNCFPFERDRLKDLTGLACGNPVVFRSRRLEAWLSFEPVYVLELASYRVTHTLKDPRSWFVMNVALEQGLRHLAVWTAGNAGLSLAILAREVNHSLPADQRIQVYALFDHHESAVDLIVQQTLRSWECELIPVPSTTKRIVPPLWIEEQIRSRALGLPGEWDHLSYWDVTDGWEGVGTIAYRLLMAQVIRDVAPTHVVCPLGTGNFVLGSVLGSRDVSAAYPERRQSPTIIGAVPEGANIVREICRRKAMQPAYAPRRKAGRRPMMPKISATYTPLLPCIDTLLERGEIRVSEVGTREHNLAARRLSSREGDRRILCEPSAMAAFAALPSIAGGPEAAGGKLLVVNSGLGVLSAEEQRFLAETGSYTE